MMHKLRAVMGLRDDEYSLNNEVELDEGFSKQLILTEIIPNFKKRSSSEKQTKVLVSTESKKIDSKILLKNITRKLSLVL